MKRTLQITMMCLFMVLVTGSCKKEKEVPVQKKGIIMISTVIGDKRTGQAGYVNGPATNAELRAPNDLAIDPAGNLYIADTENNAIRKVTKDGVVSTLAGNIMGVSGYQDGTGTEAQFNYPTGVALDAAGNVYVADLNNHCIRKITPAGVVTTFAGSNTSGSADGTGADARFNGPAGLVVAPDGNIYVADAYSNMIRKITPGGVVSTLAGNGGAGSTDGTGAEARFNGPFNIKVGPDGNIYVADTYNNKIRKVTPSGVVTTFAGRGNGGFDDGLGESIATFREPQGLAFDAEGNLYVGDYANNLIRKITPDGNVLTLVGLTGVEYYRFGGFKDGTSLYAQFRNPSGLAVSVSGDIYVADLRNNAIRKISFE